jgi:glycerol-3-phosphate dehydrogenase
MNASSFRRAVFDQAGSASFDVAIVGGGINGACLYHHLCSAGYRVLLVDKGDFASGTSQASAMMIWGGLLYLSTLDVATVLRLSASRNRLVREMPDSVQRLKFRYISARQGGRNLSFVHFVLYLYWILGFCRSERPHHERSFSEASLFKAGGLQDSLTYEEAGVAISDSRFVLGWILPNQNSHNIPINHCELVGGVYDESEGMWRLDLKDRLCRDEFSVRARFMVNAAGAWTDSLNARFNMETPFRHVLAKGVFIGLRRSPELQIPVIVDGGRYSDCLSLIPWGPISLWGPTETTVNDPSSGFAVNPEDIRFLLSQLNRHRVRTANAGDIVSLRCGVRPLVVERSFSGSGPTLQISRHHRSWRDSRLPWISVYGGKLTSCVSLARKVLEVIMKEVKPSLPAPEEACSVELEQTTFAGLSDRVPSASWCMQNELCWSLDDYLRRRTNISQWIPRGGLGEKDENLTQLKEIANVFSNGDSARADHALHAYRQKIRTGFDSVLATV